ncbi:MAG: prepilin-type N-terminal cleavage/methylation domain-containing protein [Finegoldia magna]|uniref:prepilin-type N-terminal cleavage/methylation domain-containing protein n=1 Tax=Finegoldia magna TaxID=1260 RepID=UPI002902467B|nr:prepilin-type N-terminal cleavage/methylation domain-containing protein [Finegoldia magna]MDU1010945.1 prepilin-type N-terminal cleavage/methylation domain-containing protein [Finegoldia magna]MDU1086507.1 prepilin-type N-terminal cleavage/methylation domain-containing protein [Finegoldia magna]
MRRKTKGFTLLEVLFALFLVSLCVVVYYPQLKNVIKMQDKSYTENIVLRDLDNSVEYLKAHDDVDSSIVDENSKVIVRKVDVGDLVKVNVKVVNGEIAKDVSFYKEK